MAEWITVTLASRQTGIAERTIRHWITKGKVTAKKEKGRWLIDSDSLSSVGKAIADDSARSARVDMISVPLERYEGLITRLAQLEAENASYKKMLEAPKERRRRGWFSRFFRRSQDTSN